MPKQLMIDYNLHKLNELYHKDEQYAYVYEYGEYTIVANTIFYKKENKFDQVHFTSYTIIYWNPLSKTGQNRPNHPNAVINPIVNSRLQAFNYKLTGLQERAGHLQKEMMKFQVFQYNPVLIDHSMTENLDYFVPAILMKPDYTYRKEYSATAEFGGFYIVSPTFKQRVLLESKRYEMHVCWVKTLLAEFSYDPKRLPGKTWFDMLEIVMTSHWRRAYYPQTKYKDTEM